MAFIERLRTEPTLAHKAGLNILAHPAGAAHLKMGIIGSATQAVGFTGGLDLQSYRYSNWRDVQTRVTGPAAQVFFDAFAAMWTEVKGRTPVRLSAANGHAAGHPVITLYSHTTAMPDLPARSVVSTAAKKLHVQAARTLPKFNFPTIGSLTGLPRNQTLSFAPNGLFEVRTVWEKALKAAQTYIYIEDQAFTSFEVFDWVNAAVKASPELQVVLLTGQGDPNDAASDVPSKLFGKAVNDHLLNGLSAADQARIGVFRHLGLTIHSKTSIVDDNWALIGSANSMRRSLYTDFEHSVAFMDEDNLAVSDYRANLWGKYFGHSIATPQEGLRLWFAIPLRGAGPPHSSNIERLRIPFTVSAMTADEQVLADEVFDCDSRDVWGDDLIRLYMRQTGAGSFSP
jgi:phosphatidylserine/phosphatidylglycerophosphate/cardiolipin synthase-like enzyme